MNRPSPSSRKVTPQELGLSWSYWLSTGVFAVMFCVAVGLILTGEGNERNAGWGLGAVALVFGGGGVAWPVMRMREPQGIQTEIVRTPNIHCEAILLPASRVKQYVALFGSLLLALAAVALGFVADDTGDRVQAAIGAVFWASAFILCWRSMQHGRLGILLLPEGVIWRELFRAPYFIPWNTLSDVSLFQKKEQHTKPLPTLGLNVTDPTMVQTTARARKKLLESRSRHGWHLYFFAETLTVPLTVAVRALQFYKDHPEARCELGTSSAMNRLLQLEITPASRAGLLI